MKRLALVLAGSMLLSCGGGGGNGSGGSLGEATTPLTGDAGGGAATGSGTAAPAAGGGPSTPAAAPAASDVAAGHPWMNTALSPADRANALIAAMTLDQKIEQMQNVPTLNTELQDENPPCGLQDIGRHIEGIPELQIPTLRFANGGNGIRGGDCTPEPTATAFPATTAGAATFNPDIMFQWGQVLGDEVHNWAHYALWGPAMNIIRTPYGGRNQEYMSEDPYLTGVIATQQVLGVQAAGTTHATIKHFAGNESEFQRERWTAASNIPSRAMHEIYLLPFEMAVRDGKAAAVMCAFPYLNSHWACENSALLKQTLRGRWGFDGYIVSDRRALHSTAASILAGTGYRTGCRPAVVHAGEDQGGHPGRADQGDGHRRGAAPEVRQDVPVRAVRPSPASPSCRPISPRTTRSPARQPTRASCC